MKTKTVSKLFLIQVITSTSSLYNIKSITSHTLDLQSNFLIDYV